jgi:hypothetical protein
MSLVFPLVVCASNGGPYDDAAFVAGYEMGLFNQRCLSARAWSLFQFTATIRRANLPQADLIAMHHGLSMLEQSDDATDEWATVIVSAVPPL